MFARIANICSMSVVDVVIETDVAEVLVHIRRKRAAHNILKRVRRARLTCREGRQERAYSRHCLRPRGITEGALPESDINALGKIFLAGEKEQFVLNNRSADRSAELVKPQRRLFHAAIEIVARIEPVVANVFEQVSMPAVRAGFGGDGDLAAGTPAEFRRVGAAFDMKLLDVLETLRQAEP